MSRILQAGVCVSVLAALCIAVWSVATPTEVTADATPTVQYVPVRTAPVEIEAGYEVTRRYTGEVVALRTSDLSFQREGYVKAIHVREGSQIQADDVIATLDTRRLKEQLREAAAAEREANAVLEELIAGPRSQELRAALENVNGLTERLGFARSIRARKESLRERNAGSMDDLEDSRSRERQLAADLAVAKEELDKLNEGSRREKVQAQQARVDQLVARRNLLQIELDDSVLRAPYAGRIAQRYNHEGTVIQKGTPIVRLLEAGRLTARIGVPLDAAADLKPGEAATVDANGKSYDAQIHSRLPALSDATRTATVILDLCDAAANELIAGQIVHLNVNQSVQETGCWVPTNALARGTRGLWSCLAVSEVKSMPGVTENDSQIGLLKKQDVEILHVGEAKVFVRGTLSSGDRIISDGTHRVAQGQWVEVLSDEQAE